MTRSEDTVRANGLKKLKETVEIYFIIGENHDKRELAILSDYRSQPIILQPPQKRTSPLPVFHENSKTSQILDLKLKNIYDAGSNSLKNGREYSLGVKPLELLAPISCQLQNTTNSVF